MRKIVYIALAFIIAFVLFVKMFPLLTWLMLIASVVGLVAYSRRSRKLLILVLAIGYSSSASAQTTSDTVTPVSSYGVMFTLPAAPIAAGTVELEVQSVFATGPNMLVPAVLKFNPDLNLPGLHNNEIAVFSDSFQTFVNGSSRENRSVQDIGVITRKPVYNHGVLGISVGPWATYIRDGGGVVGGLRTMVAVLSGQNSVFVNVNFGHASRPNDDNPLNRSQLQTDFFRTFAKSGKLSSLGWSVGAQFEKLTDQSTTFSLAEGGYYQFRPDVELDFGFHHTNLNTQPSHQFWLGLAKNFGKVHKQK